MNLLRLYDNKIIKLILNFAREKNEVRAVLINGSRVNPNAPIDIMQDYDIVFFTNAFQEDNFRKDWQWIYSHFGEPIIVQQLDNPNSCYTFLMQFEDFRIDLSIRPIDQMNEVAKNDSLSYWLVDKDKLASEIPTPNESSYWIQKPDKKTFEMTLNEAWWIQPYVAKGIWRDEFPYVRQVYDKYLMDAIKKLVSWKIGLNHNWQVNPGSAGKWFKSFVDAKEYKEFLELYSTRDYYDIWESLFKAGKFIRRIGIYLANELGYEYPYIYDKRVTNYLRKIRGQTL